MASWCEEVRLILFQKGCIWNTKKRCPFHYRGLECKRRKSRNTWGNRQIWHMDIIRWSTPKSDWLSSLQPRWRSSIQSAKTRLEADCGSDNELFIAKFRLKLKKVGKTIRPFRFDLNQISYDYTVEMRNRFKGLDLMYRVPEELWMEVCDIVQKAVIKTIPKGKKCKKSNGSLRRLYK